MSGSIHPASILLTILLLMLGLGFTHQLLSDSIARASSRAIYLVGYISGWNYSQPSGSNPQLIVSHGESATVQLSSGDAFPHQFLVDVDNDGSDTADCGTVDLCSTAFSTSATTYDLSTNLSPGTYTYYCSVHPSTMFGKFLLQGFGIASTPNSFALVQGSTSNSIITVTGSGGFTGLVNLTASISPTAPKAMLSPTSVRLSTDGSATSTLTISTSSSTPPGSYTATISGSDGTISQTVTVPVTVKPSNSTGESVTAWIIPSIAAGVGVAVTVGVLVKKRKSANKPPKEH